MKKKILAAVVAVAMVLCAMPIASYADDTEVWHVKTEKEFLTALNEATPVSGTIVLDNEITVNQPIVIKSGVTLEGATLTAGDGVEGNFITFLNSDMSTAKLKDIKIVAGEKTRNAILVHGMADVYAENLKVDHSKAATGAPIVVNGSHFVATGTLSLELGNNSWYGINSDNSVVDVSKANITINTPVATQSVVCVENGGEATVSGLTKVVTDDGQTAYVQDEDLPEFVAAKKDNNVTEIVLDHNVSLYAPLYLYNATHVIGNGHAFVGTEELGKDNVVTVMTDGVVFENITIKTSAANKSPLHLYKADATLKNVALDNRETVGGAALILNGGSATVQGGLDIYIGENSWGSINIDEKNGDSNITFENGSALKVEAPDGKSVIYVENDNGIGETVAGAENVGLVQDADGNYVVAGTEEPTQPGDNTGNTDNDNNAAGTDKENTADSPKTGDESAYGLLIALMMLSAAGVYALRRNVK